VAALLTTKKIQNQQTANVLDLVLTNEQGTVDKINYNEPIGRSDHLVLDWKYRCYAQQSGSEQWKYLYSKADYDGMRADLAAVTGMV